MNDDTLAYVALALGLLALVLAVVVNVVARFA